MGLFRRKGSKAEITVNSQVVDAGNMAGLSDEIMETLKAHGIEPGQSRVIDASQIPGLTEEIMGALNESGVMQQAWSSVFTPADEDTPVEQLEKLAELHKEGVLTDYEFAVAKQKLLGERWES